MNIVDLNKLAMASGVFVEQPVKSLDAGQLVSALGTVMSDKDMSFNFHEALKANPDGRVRIVAVVIPAK